MGISYNPSIPATNNSPANDQPLMQQNFSSINMLINVDHVNFSDANYGKHNQVTFAANNTPSFPASEPVLFSSLTDGNSNNFPGSVAQLLLGTGADTASYKQYLSAANGSVLLLGGIIMKWGAGSKTGTGGGNATTFANTFPNNCFVVLIIGTDPAYTGGFVSTSLTQSSFNAIRTSGSGVTGFYYIAIGN